MISFLFFDAKRRDPVELVKQHRDKRSSTVDIMISWLMLRTPNLSRWRKTCCIIAGTIKRRLLAVIGEEWIDIRDREERNGLIYEMGSNYFLRENYVKERKVTRSAACGGKIFTSQRTCHGDVATTDDLRCWRLKMIR